MSALDTTEKKTEPSPLDSSLQGRKFNTADAAGDRRKDAALRLSNNAQVPLSKALTVRCNRLSEWWTFEDSCCKCVALRVNWSRRKSVYVLSKLYSDGHEVFFFKEWRRRICTYCWSLTPTTTEPHLFYPPAYIETLWYLHTLLLIRLTLIRTKNSPVKLFSTFRGLNKEKKTSSLWVNYFVCVNNIIQPREEKKSGLLSGIHWEFIAKTWS